MSFSPFIYTIKMYIPEVFRSGCHSFFDDGCSDWFYSELQELEGFLYVFLIETNEETVVGEGTESRYRRVKE